MFKFSPVSQWTHKKDIFAHFYSGFPPLACTESGRTAVKFRWPEKCPFPGRAAPGWLRLLQKWIWNANTHIREASGGHGAKKYTLNLKHTNIIVLGKIQQAERHTCLSQHFHTWEMFPTINFNQADGRQGNLQSQNGFMYLNDQIYLKHGTAAKSLGCVSLQLHTR